jgi:hypothetical protein
MSAVSAARSGQSRATSALRDTHAARAATAQGGEFLRDILRDESE